MMPDKDLIREVFLTARELADDQRNAYLDAACANRPELRDEVESLLANDDTLPGPLDGPVFGDILNAVSSREVMPESIGPYHIIEKLGEGGFGTVYLAEQRTPIKRLVAVKVIKLGMDTKAITARFDAERQALALMNHPNIAAVFDAGSTNAASPLGRGRPYFVMEYVPGELITKYCDRHRLDIRARLELFIQVCNAVQHAHQKAVIHRDIKPSNVLVRLQDNKPVPKVIDFGVAKAINQRLTEQTIFTHQGMLIGTPEYMSPEQAEMSQLDIDTRTDVYSLGVLLYELLTGSLPFDPKVLRSKGYAEIQRIIREFEPAKPSTRLSGEYSGTATRNHRRRANEAKATSKLPADIKFKQQDDDSAHQRGTDLHTLVRIIRGDLDWIVMKCLEKDRTRRYETANALAFEIQRYLNGEPVLAGPPSAIYRVRKFVGRHRAGVRVGVAVAILLVTSLVVISALYLKAESAKRSEARLAQQAFEDRDAARVAQHDSDQRRHEAEVESYVANLAAAQAALNYPDLYSASRHLDAAPPSLRNWEWYHLHSRLDESLAVLRGHSPHAWIWSVDFSPDSSLLVSAGTDGTARVWNVPSGLELFVYRGQHGKTLRAIFRPDGSEIASSSTDGTVRTWNPETGEDHLVIDLEMDSPRALAYTPSGANLVVGTANGNILWYDATSGELLNRLRAHDGVVMFLTFSSDGRRLASCSYSDRRTRIWDANSRALLYEPDQRSPTYTCAFTPDGQRIVTGSWAGAVIWQIDQGRWQRHFDRPRCGWNVAIDPTSNLLAASTDDGVAFFSYDTAQLRFALNGSGRTQAIAFSPDGRLLATGDQTGRVRIWCPEPHRYDLTDANSGGTLNALAVSHGGHLLASARMGEGPYQVLDTETGAIAARFTQQHAPILTVAFTPDDRGLIAGHSDDSVTVADVSTGSVREFCSESSAVNAVAVDPIHNALLEGLESGELVERDIATGQERTRTQPHADAIYALAISNDGRWLASGSLDRCVRIYNRSVGDMEGRPLLGHQQAVFSLAFNNDGSCLASGSADATIRLWNSATGRDQAVLKGHRRSIKALAFSPDGDRLFSGSWDGTLKVWDVGEQRDLLTFRNPFVDWVWSLAALPNGGQLVVSSWIEQNLSTLDTMSEFDRHALPMRAWVNKHLDAGRTPEEVLDLIRHDPKLDPALQQCAQVALLRRSSQNMEEADRRVRELFNKTKRMNEVIAQIRSNPRYLPSLKTTMLRLANSYARAPQFLNEEAWDIVKLPGRTQEAYEHALELVQRPIVNSQGNGLYLNTLGVAQYRNDDILNAFATLTVSDTINALPQPEPNLPYREHYRGRLVGDVAFLLMATARLGLKDEALQLRAELMNMASLPEVRANEDDLAILNEAMIMIDSFQWPAAPSPADLANQLERHDADAAMQLMGVARWYFERGNLLAAETMCRRAIDIADDLTPNLISKLESRMAELADEFLARKKWDITESLARKCLAMRSERIPTHWTTADTSCLLGEALAAQHQFEKAEPLLLQGYQAMLTNDEAPADRRQRAAQRIAQLYNDWSSTLPKPAERATKLMELAKRARELGNAAEALPLFQSALQLQRRTGGSSELSVAQVLTDLGKTLGQLGRCDEAISALSEALRIRQTALGNDHIDIAWTLHDLGWITKSCKEYDASMKWFQSDLEMRHRLFGDDDAQLAFPLLAMANLSVDRGEIAVAGEYFDKAFAIRHAALGPHHEQTLDTLQASLRYRIDATRNFAAIEPLLLDCYQQCESALGPQNPTTVRTASCLMHLYELWGHYGDLARWRSIYRKSSNGAFN
ncbi:MAG: protein kinase [Phycisphaerales bacterium]|nr:protein kinase [Phycisphaerales bacterium]MCB9855351.1 protein kinase [Phycisphaerales bacterium]MCB9862944.1 protein kinase [Phycisphaerales bacterium]